SPTDAPTDTAPSAASGRCGPRLRADAVALESSRVRRGHPRRRFARRLGYDAQLGAAGGLFHDAILPRSQTEATRQHWSGAGRLGQRPELEGTATPLVQFGEVEGCR